MKRNTENDPVNKLFIFKLIKTVKRESGSMKKTRFDQEVEVNGEKNVSYDSFVYLSTLCLLALTGGKKV